MEFQNKIKQLNFPKPQQTALNILRDYMIFKNIAVIEHDDFFINDTICNNEPNLAMFWYKKTKQKHLLATRNCIILRCMVLKLWLNHLI